MTNLSTETEVRRILFGNNKQANTNMIKYGQKVKVIDGNSFYEGLEGIVIAPPNYNDVTSECWLTLQLLGSNADGSSKLFHDCVEVGNLALL